MLQFENIYKRSPIVIQNIMLNAKAIELYYERYGYKFNKKMKFFQENLFKSYKELKEYQSLKLRSLIKDAYHNVPYYRKIMKLHGIKLRDIDSVEDLEKFPVLKKEHIKNHFQQLISKKHKKILLRHGHTSGTTGTPLDVKYDIQTCVVHHVADWRQKQLAGMNFGDPYASIQGRVIVPLEQTKPPFWRKNYVNNQLFLSAFHLTEKNIPFYLEKLYKENIKFIEGYPSNLYILSLYLNKYNQKLPMTAVLTSSETLFDHQRQSIEKSFDCNMFDFYGMAERTVFASECSKHTGKHINMDYGITEFLDSDDNPVSKGNLGRIIGTSLHNYAMPLIRYETNDSCTLKSENCSCGCQFPIMDNVTTKNESIVTLPDGRLISPSVLTHPFKPMHNILESQIIQKDYDLINIKIVKNINFTYEDEKVLIKSFKERLGNDIRIQIDYVKQIQKSESGKLKWVMSHIKPEF